MAKNDRNKQNFLRFCPIITIEFSFTSIVTDRGKKECVDPEVNGVTMREGAEGGPSPPSGE
jgi:hypothetical protein